jgi:hypothetical protein
MKTKSNFKFHNEQCNKNTCAHPAVQHCEPFSRIQYASGEPSCCRHTHQLLAKKSIEGPNAVILPYVKGPPHHGPTL